MLLQIYKNLIVAFVFAGALVISGCQLVYATDCSSLGSELSAGQTPSLQQLVCPITALFNIAAIAAAAVFVCFVIYGAIKASMALGDPKALKGAHQTWIYAAVGAAVILLAGAILLIIMTILGVDVGELTNWRQALFDALEGVSTRDELLN
jgi:hypothetical protein